MFHIIFCLFHFWLWWQANKMIVIFRIAKQVRDIIVLCILRWHQWKWWRFAVAVQILFHDFILQAAVFMGFSITSAVFSGIIIILYSLKIEDASSRGYYCSCYCVDHGYGGCGNVTCKLGNMGPRYTYNPELGLAAVILALGIIGFGTGIWVSICLCLMKPCCRNLEVSFILS